MDVILLAQVYFAIGLVVLIINSVLAGFNGVQPGRDDFIQSLLWPVSIATLIGILIRIAVENNKGKQPAKQAVKKEVKKEDK